MKKGKTKEIKNESKNKSSLVFNPEKEYEMLRTEILQYIEEYQTVRNMMYVAMISILGFNRALWNNTYLVLLPLIVILPSYIIFYDYWKCVTCASTYIQVFLEDETIQKSYHWETRHRDFSILLSNACKKKGKRITDFGMHFQQIPYLVCEALCLSLYWINIVKKYINLFAKKPLTYTEIINDVDMWKLIFDFLLGISAIFLCVFVGKKFFKVNENEFIKIWNQVKKPGSEEIRILKEAKEE